MDTTQPSDFPEYNNETGPVWERLAGFWDDTIGDGNGFQDYLVEPYSEQLLDLKPGERVLDIACGGGRFTRRMEQKQEPPKTPIKLNTGYLTRQTKMLCWV